MANSRAATFNTVIRHSDDGGERNDKEKRERHVWQAQKPTYHWFVVLLTNSLPFCFFRNPFRQDCLNRIVLNDGTNSNSVVAVVGCPASSDVVGIFAGTMRCGVTQFWNGYFNFWICWLF